LSGRLRVLRGRAKPTNQPGKLLTRDEARRVAGQVAGVAETAAVLTGSVVTQQTIVTIALTMAVVAMILMVALLWPLGRLPWP
jgi:hypothetical protein